MEIQQEKLKELIDSETANFAIYKQLGLTRFSGDCATHIRELKKCLQSNN